MSLTLLAISVISVVGLVLFSMFLHEIWKEKEKRRSRKNWDKFDNF